MPVKVHPKCHYTKSHEWIRVEGDYGFVGITDYAQQQLSDIVYVEMPDIGDSFGMGEMFGTIESVKAASDCYLPVAGEIVETNEELEASPDLVNKAPYDEGWFVKILVEDSDEVESLMDAAQYAKYAERALQEGGH